MTTLNEYIVQNSAQGGCSADFLQEFGSAEVYFSILSPDNNLKEGPLLTSSDVVLRMKTARTQFGEMALFYTTKGDARLLGQFAGMPLIKAAEMTAKMPDVGGMLIQSDGDAWIAVDKAGISLATAPVDPAPRTRGFK